MELEVMECMEWIRTEFFEKETFTAEEVYLHERDVSDEVMYLALDHLVETDELAYIGDEDASTHREMVYEVVT
mgnify:CR=1 FL=1